MGMNLWGKRLAFLRFVFIVKKTIFAGVESFKKK